MLWKRYADILTAKTLSARCSTGGPSLAIDPKLVRKDLICDNAPKDPTDELHACGLRRVEFRGISLPLPRTNRKITDNGWYGSDHPSTATVEWGTEMLNTTADFLVDYMRAFEKIPLDAE